MPQFIEYLIKLSATLMAIYLLYWLVLRRLTFYHPNRWYLLGYSVISFLIPLVNISPVLEKARISDHDIFLLIPSVETNGLQVNNTMAENVSPWDTGTIIIILFCAGCVLMLIRFIFQYFSVRSIRRASTLISDGDVKLYHTDKDVIPFSFGNSIIVNQEKHSEDDLRHIIRHEFIHVKEKHTVDIIWSEWLCILNWYNPFAWLIRRAIRQNLEFIADSKVIANGIDKKQYQYILLKVIGTSQYHIATRFNFTSLKKRITMMNKMGSAKVHSIKFLFVLPLMAVILLAFRNRQNHPITERNVFKKSSVGISESVDKNIFDTVPFVTPPVISQHHYIPVPNKKGFIITIADNNGECVVIIKNNQQKIVKALTLVEWNGNEKKYLEQYGEIPPVPAADTNKKDQKSATMTSADEQLNPIAPEDISSIQVKNKKFTLTFKNGQSEVYDLNNVEQKTDFEKKYSFIRASPGADVPKTNIPGPVIILEDDKNDKRATIAEEKENDVTLSFDIRQAGVINLDSGGKVTVKTLGDFEGLIIVNGREYDRKSFENEVKLDENQIKTVEVFKGAGAKQLYGEKGKNGVIKITTKTTFY